MSTMFTSKAKDGRLVTDPVVALPEGATVTVLNDGHADDDGHATAMRTTMVTS
jgi:hypothetical protein